MINAANNYTTTNWMFRRTSTLLRGLEGGEVF